MDPEPFIVPVKTDHYTFTMKIQERLYPHSYYFVIGDTKRPCLQFSVLMPDVPSEFRSVIDTVHLGHVEALETCAENDINAGYMNTHSMGKELIHIAISTIKHHFPHVLYIQLSDKSYIPCRREWNETLDLLTYSIALYGKTWYEKTYNAGFDPPTAFLQYRATVNTYMTPEYKSKVPFDILLKYFVIYPNEYARNHIYSNLDTYKTMYESSDTFPIFFRRLLHTVPNNDKCKLFKSWLEAFIHERILDIPRTWIFRIDGRPLSVRTKKSRATRRTYKDRRSF
jgi:hypothetical protein